MKIVWYLLFSSCVIAGLAAVLLHAAGRPDLASIVGAVFTVLMGLAFLFGCFISASTIGEAWIIGVGWITRQSRPRVYWTALSVPMSVGLAVFLVGIYWCYQLIRG